jgi:hypothetical protein
MLLRNRNSVIAILNPLLESLTSAIFGIFLAKESGLFINKKIGFKKSRATVPLRQVLFAEKNNSKNNFG